MVTPSFLLLYFTDARYSVLVFLYNGQRVSPTRYYINKDCIYTDTYPAPRQTSRMEIFVTMFYGFQLLRNL